MNTKKYTAADAARMFGVPIENVKRIYALNAKAARESAARAAASKTGKYNGFTADWYLASAAHAEEQAK